jgi:isopentenyl phosphate kinase
MTTVVKLGGSVITEKNRVETVDKERLTDLASALSGHEDLVIVHGAGSFGHHHAAKHSVSVTEGTHDAEAIREIHGSMERLNERVIETLAMEEIPAVSVAPFPVGYRGRTGDLHFPLGQVQTMLGEGFVPVLYGDVISHRDKGATIISGDELVVALVEGLDADLVGLCSTVPGVLDDVGEVIDEIGSYDDVAAYLGGSESTDVTGGMAAKVRALLELDARASIFGPEVLEEFLENGVAGTRID